MFGDSQVRKINASESAIHVRNLSKTFGPTIALERIDLDVNMGDVLVIAGPNGSGKSTLLKILCGIIRHSADGEVTVFGMDPWRYRHTVFEKTTAMFEDYSFPDLVTGEEYLKFIVDMRKVDGSPLSHLKNLFGLSQFWQRSIRNYSSGMKKKLALAQMFIGDPKLMIFDEPFIALDKSSRTELIEELYRRKKNGSTIIISSHILVGLDGLANSFTAMINGRIVRQVDLGSHNAEIEDLYKEVLEKT